jgi:hypothetical protein
MPLGHRDRNHARKPRTSLTPVMITRVLFRRWPGGTGAVGAEVVPTGVPLRGPEMSQESCDMRLLAVSEEAAESDEPDSFAVGLSVPLCGREARPAVTAAYAGLCFSKLLIATCPSAGVVAHELLPEASSGAGRREAGSVEESKPDWLAFLLLLLSSRREGALAEPPALRMATALFSLLADKAFLSSLSRAGDCLAAEIAFKKARSSCFSISCKQEIVLVRIKSLTGGEHSLCGRNSLRTLAYTFMYSCSTEYSEERPFTSLVNHPIGHSGFLLARSQPTLCHVNGDPPPPEPEH